MVWGIGLYFGAHIMKKKFGCFENYRQEFYMLYVSTEWKKEIFRGNKKRM